MKNIIVVGSGGFASEITEYIKDNIRHIRSYPYRLKGYLDIKNTSARDGKAEKPVLGDERAYKLSKNDYFIVAIGKIELRAKIINILQKKNAKFINFIHHTVLVGSTSRLGEGNIICPYCIIGPHVKLGDFNLLNYYTSIAHAVNIGNNNVFSPNNVITGEVVIGNDNFFGSSVTILPSIRIGSNVKVQTGVAVDKDIKDGNFCFCPTKNETAAIFRKET